MINAIPALLPLPNQNLDSGGRRAPSKTGHFRISKILRGGRRAPTAVAAVTPPQTKFRGGRRAPMAHHAAAAA